MTEDRAERALREALAHRAGEEEFAPLDPDALRAGALRADAGASDAAVTPDEVAARRRRRATPGVVAVAASLLVLLVLPVAMLVPRLGEQVESSAASASDQPAGGAEVAEGSSADTDDTTVADASPAAAAPCPTAGEALGGIGDFPVLLVWDKRTYVGWVQDATGPVGTVVGTVRCDILAISEDGTRTVSQPWPDGTSTLPAGSVIHEVPGEEARCTLAVRFADQDALLYARDTPGCPTP